MGSKYTPYWQNRLDDVARLLDEAYRNGISSELDVSDIKEFGERSSGWHGHVQISKHGITKKSRGHATALGEVILSNELIAPYGDLEFRMAISRNLRLTATTEVIIVRERLLKLIPEFDLIEDADLREKCLKTWEAAMREGGWIPDDLAKMPFTLLINPCPASYIDHIRAVTLSAVRAAEVFTEIYGDRVPVNMDLLVAGGLLHDIGKLLEYENRDDGMTVQTYAGKLLRHPFTGMELAARFGLPAEVQHIIAAHAGEGDKVKRTTEATLINHADFMSFHSIKRMVEKKELAAKMG